MVDQAPWATVEAEPMLKEAIFNLLHNGVKFQNNDPAIVQVKIMEDDNGMIRIEVEDHGPGIPDRIKDMVFDRLFHASRKAQSGIGLSLVKELITRYGGEIRVEDRIEGDHDQGTRFIILMRRA
jgi:signal transduction histidine kinase